jgi:hypothetical protein
VALEARAWAGRLAALDLSRGARTALGLLAPQLLASYLGRLAVLAEFTAYTLVLTEGDAAPPERVLLHLLAFVPLVGHDAAPELADVRLIRFRRLRASRRGLSL